jgi:hypothetical protein
MSSSSPSARATTRKKCCVKSATPKIRIIPTQWNERIQPDYSVKGFVYGQQKSIALFNCTGDWAFYLEADEVVHENDLPKIRAAMERHLDAESSRQFPRNQSARAVEKIVWRLMRAAGRPGRIITKQS